MGGMKIEDLEQSIAYLTSFKQNDPPTYILIHCGGNDIGLKTSAAIIADLKIIIDNIRSKFPYTKIIWSQILPRRSWRYMPDVYHADRARKRINSSIATYVINGGGHYLKYPDITLAPMFFRYDDTHLSPTGYDLMLNSISGAIYSFRKLNSPIFPM
jgi:lysophospholipase L1-like esterase